VSEAIKLVHWLAGQQLELADLRQDLVDEWIAVGPRQRRRVRLFLTWLGRANVTGALNVDWDDRLSTRPAIDDLQRFAILRRLLHSQDVDPRDRFVGSVLLLYGKLTTRIAALRTTDIRTTPEGVITLRLGRGEIPLPEPLAAVAQALRDHQLQRTAMGGWLIPGRPRRAAHHRRQAAAAPEALRDRAQPRRPTRRAARAARAGRAAPAPVLAERIGIHQSRVAAWVRMADSTYAQYMALRCADSTD
jgi:hypothetical protein